MDKRKVNDRYKQFDSHEVDKYLQSELQKLTTKTKQEKLVLEQQHCLDLLQEHDMPKKKSSGTSTPSPNQASPLVSSPNYSVCPICHHNGAYETVVTWKDCHHTLLSIPPLFLDKK